MRERVYKVKKEAVPVGRLLGVGGETIGWVYHWDTSEISILWLSNLPVTVSIVFAPQPGCDRTTCDDVVGLLRTLRADDDND